jgi:hypothetical protein
MAFYNMNNNDEEQPREQQQQQPKKRLDARSKNNKYAPGTGPKTGQTAIRTGTINRDGTTSPVSATFGTATGSLSQPLAQFSAEQLQQMKEANRANFGKRPGRIDARPRNNIYMPGTGPGTGRTAIRVGTINRDGSTSPVSSTFGAATGSLSQRSFKLMTPRPTPPDAYAQRQSNVANAKANGTFDVAREKFNAANSGQIMDEQGNISKNPNATKFDQVPDGLGGYKMVPVPPKKTPPVKPKAVAATGGLDGTIKTTTEPFGKNPLKGMEMPKPLAPAVLGASGPAVPSASPTTTAAAASPLGVKPEKAAPSSVLSVTGTGTLGASTQSFGSGSGGLGMGGPLKLPAKDPRKISARAKGGPVQAGKPYLVGEEGPEIIVPGQSGTVVPNHKITAADVRAARRAQSQQRSRFLTPRQTPAEAYALLRVNKESAVHRQASAAASEKKDSTKRHANAPKSRFFEARPTPANAAEYLRGRHLAGRANGGRAG